VVAQLIRLKARVTWNSLTRQVWVLVLSILGVLYGLGVIAALVFSAIAAAVSGYLDIVAPVMVILGALLVLGWIMVPVVFASMDNTLDPRRFAPYVGPSRRFALGLVAATPVGISGLFTTLVGLVPVAVWLAGGDPLAALMALVGTLLALATSFLWARVASTWLGIRATSTAGRRDLMSVLATLLFIAVLAPMGIWMNLLMQNFDADYVHSVAGVVAWSPFGAPWALAASVHGGAWGTAVLQFVVTAAFLALGWWLWQRVLPAAMCGTAHRLSPAAEEAVSQGRALVDPDAVEDAPESPADAQGAGPTGAARNGMTGVERWQRLGLGAPAASLAERTQRYWLRDPRLSTSLLSSLIFPAMAVFWTRFSFGDEGGPGIGMSVFFMLMLPLIIGQVVGSLLQYDSTAFWLLVASGIRGRSERLGRLVGSLPLCLGVLVVSCVAFGMFSTISADAAWLLGAGVLLVFSSAAAVAMVIGARWVYPVQPPGASPMSTKGTGQFLTTMIIQSLQWVLAFVAAAPAGAVLLWAQFGTTVPVALACGLALVWSTLLLVAGVLVGGRIWDASNVEVLSKIRAWPGHGAAA
jgi:hypothetical protein